MAKITQMLLRSPREGESGDRTPYPNKLGSDGCQKRCVKRECIGDRQREKNTQNNRAAQGIACSSECDSTCNTELNPILSNWETVSSG